MNRFATIALLTAAACRPTTASEVPEAPDVPGESLPPSQPEPDEPEPTDSLVSRLLAASEAASVPGLRAADDRQIVVCEGEIWSEAHLPRPGDRIHAHVQRSFLLDASAGTVEMHESARVDADTWVTRVGMQGDDVVISAGDAFTRPPAAERAAWRLALLSPFPSQLSQELLARSTATGIDGDHLWGAGRAPAAWDAWIGPPSAPLTIRFDSHDPTWGDVTERYVWERPADGSDDTTTVTRLRDGEVIETLRCRAAAETSAELGTSFMPLPETVEPPQPVPLEIAEIAPGVFALEYVHLDHRSIVVVQDDGLLVIEAPVDAAAGELLLRTIAERWTDLPVRHLVVTHHHPDHAGAIRPFIARGIPIVTTPGNVDYFERVAAADWGSAPDEQWRSPRRPVFELVTKERRLGRVQIFDIGPRTTHTEEDLVVYVPAAHLLVHGDLAGARPDGEVRPAGPRTQGLAAAIRERKLDVRTLVGTWPLHRVSRTMSAAQLRRAIELSKRAPKP